MIISGDALMSAISSVSSNRVHQVRLFGSAFLERCGLRLAPCPAGARGSRRTRPSAPAGRSASAAGVAITRKAIDRGRMSSEQDHRDRGAQDAALRSRACTAEPGRCSDRSARCPVPRGSRADPFHVHLDADGLARPGLRLVLEQVLARDLLAELVEDRREVLRASPARTGRLPAAARALSVPGLKVVPASPTV